MLPSVVVFSLLLFVYHCEREIVLTSDCLLKVCDCSYIKTITRLPRVNAALDLRAICPLELLALLLSRTREVQASLTPGGATNNNYSRRQTRDG